jgi:hypothetical protein
LNGLDVEHALQGIFSGTQASGYQEVAAYLQGLLPIHSCGLEALQGILDVGGLQARANQAGAGVSILQTLQDDPRHFQMLTSNLRKCHITECDRAIFRHASGACERCISMVLNFAEVVIQQHRFGHTRMSRIKKERLAFGLRLQSHQQMSDVEIDELEGVAQGIARELNPASIGPGIRFWIDEKLGTSSHNFSVLGINADQ